MSGRGPRDPSRPKENDRRGQQAAAPSPPVDRPLPNPSVPPYAEMVAATNYSFLRGASAPSDMVARAQELGLAAIGIADRNSVAGVVRAWKAWRDAPERARAVLLDEKRQRLGDQATLTAEEAAACAINVRLLTGARLVFSDGTPDIIAYPASRHGWGRLCRLLTVGNMRAVKGDCILHFTDLLDYLDDLLLIVMPYSSADAQQAHDSPVDYLFADADAPRPRLTLVPDLPTGDVAQVIERLVAKTAGNVWLGASMTYGGVDGRRLERLRHIARLAGVPLIATNDVLYAHAGERALQDVLSCIRLGTHIHAAGRALEVNAERHLKSPAAMARLFHACPQAIAESIAFADRIAFDLDQLKYQYPEEPVPEGWSADNWLAHLVWKAAHARHGARLPGRMSRTICEELTFIRRQRFAHYFLTVHDLVRFARSCTPPILCQGRGSAANSVVCFLLGVTSVDPIRHDLLFSRFISENRGEPPDIDVDFEHERREEVMQYIYRRYGRHRAGIAATVIHYRSRSTVREVAKALGMSADIPVRLSSTVWGSYSKDMEVDKFTAAGFDIANPQIARLKTILDQILRAPFPRHLSQHVGGYVLTQGRLDEIVPVHHGAMQDRSFIEWDKDDIDALGLMKVDVLALGMLTCIRRAYDMLRQHDLGDYDLKVDLNSDDRLVYDMLQKGDSIGVFQVESRAQINMLPRLKPENLYDLTVQVAIVRPGPIEGDMVHPYLRRREGTEEIEYPSPAPPHNRHELRDLLGKTFGVPLFQEQAMKLAIVAAAFTPDEANELRRAMATFRNAGTIHLLRDKMINGMVARGYEPDFAARCFKQIEGFGSYGFPESHALSFARLVYVSAWIKCRYPAIFAAALLNSQPMGFYAPAQIIRDAREHGVEVRGIDVNASNWDNRLEETQWVRPPHHPRFDWGDSRGAWDAHLALRLGLRQITGFRKDWASALEMARVDGAFRNLEELARRAALPKRALRLLADADALGSLDLGRREGLWEARRTPANELPLFAAARLRGDGGGEMGAEPDAQLPDMPLSEEVAADYQMQRFSLKGHPMQFLRDRFRAEGVMSCAQVQAAKNGMLVRAAGVVLVRQRPGKGNAIFITIEDETGIANILLWARLFEMQRRPVMASRLMLVEGEVQRSKEGVVHLMASRVHDRTEELGRLSQEHQADIALSRADEVLHPQHPRGRDKPAAPDMARHPRNVRILPPSRDFH